MPTLVYIIGAVGMLWIIIIMFQLASNSLPPSAALALGCMAATITLVTIAFVLMPNKSHTSSCNQITISIKNGITCSASKGKGK